MRALPGLKIATLSYPQVVSPGLYRGREGERASSSVSLLIRILILSEKSPTLMTSLNLRYF